jgi:hypothetical protein
MNTMMGMRVIVDRPRIRLRTWFERLCTWPWRPWVKTVVVGPRLDPEQVFRVGDTIIMGDAAYQRLEQGGWLKDYQKDLATPAEIRLFSQFLPQR